MLYQIKAPLILCFFVVALNFSEKALAQKSVIDSTCIQQVNDSVFARKLRSRRLDAYMTMAKDSVCDTLRRDIDTVWHLWSIIPDCSDSADNVRIMTWYTFNRLIGKSYAKVLSDDNLLASKSSYANIKLDKDQSTATVAYAFQKGFDPHKPLRYFSTGGIKTALNSDDIFKAFDKGGFAQETITLFGNFNYAFKPTFYTAWTYEPDSAIIRWEEHCAIEKICSDYGDILADTCNHIYDYLDNRDDFESVDALDLAMRNKFSDYEEKILKPYMNTIKKYWFTLTANATFQNFDRINKFTHEQSSKMYFYPNFRLTFNSLESYLGDRKNDFYFSAWMELGARSSFTDFDTKKWNKIEKISDSTFYSDDPKNVYVYDSTNFSIQYLPSFGLQLIKFFTFSDINLGIDGTYKLDDLVSLNRHGKNYFKNSGTLGIIIPFNDKKGERTVNLEFFGNIAHYFEPSREDERYLGIKFSIPIFSSSESSDDDDK